jgi:hypothetical protein
MASRAAARRSPAAPPATGQVAGEWLRRVEAEYRSAAITQHLVLWLIQIGASPDLVRDGLRIVDDELVHAELSREVYLAAGGGGAPALDRDSLGLVRRHGELELDVGVTVARVFCLGETVAVPLFQLLRRPTTAPVARRALDRILRDEVRHRDFGWTALEWLLEQAAGERVRALVVAALPGWLTELEQSYGDELSAPMSEVTAAERAWGLAPAADYAAVLRRTIERDYRPRFARLGIALPPAAA